jgi:hypothetical protein
MGIQSMILSLKNNKRNKRNQFDKNRTGYESNYGDFVDHKKMNTYEYAAFQKKVFNEKNRQKRKYYLIILLTVIALAIILFFIPTVLNLIFN